MKPQPGFSTKASSTFPGGMEERSVLSRIFADFAGMKKDRRDFALRSPHPGYKRVRKRSPRKTTATSGAALALRCGRNTFSAIRRKQERGEAGNRRASNSIARAYKGFVPGLILRTSFSRPCQSMLYYLSDSLTHVWGPFRLLHSYLVLISLGTGLTGLLTFLALPRVLEILPPDKPKSPLAGPQYQSQGKPTGAGLVMVSILAPVLVLVLPWSPAIWGAVGCLALAMLTGWFDDRSPTDWGQLRKGLLDLLVAVVTAVFLCGLRDYTIWVPLYKDAIAVPFWVFIPMAVSVLWFTINATNCSDGVDGLAGSLILLGLFYLGAVLYGIVGHKEVAHYLLIPHNPEGARWAILVFSAAGGLGGYLWYNAEPSRVLMGDAGSRFLGLLVGIAALAAGNPILVVVVAAVVLVNGGTGLLKLGLLRLFRRLGFDTTPPHSLQEGAGRPPQHVLVRALHRIRFPLHDHLRKNLGWSNAQVLLRFMLIQAFLTPVLLVIILKLR